MFDLIRRFWRPKQRPKQTVFAGTGMSANPYNSRRDDSLDLLNPLSPISPITPMMNGSISSHTQILPCDPAPTPYVSSDLWSSNSGGSSSYDSGSSSSSDSGSSDGGSCD